MKDKVYSLLLEQNIDVNKFNIERLKKAGIDMILENIEFYYDKPYTCESVFKELFNRGVMEEVIKTKTQSFR